jgi:putative nucleotidyltransferase with HDIG domain
MTPLFETIFKYTTDIKLLELANLNQPIFQRMMMEAPGTYHHSVVVASLVEAAAEAIGANPLLAKVSAYYHDIGKLKKPLYFIENQRNGDNKHDKLSPKIAA